MIKIIRQKEVQEKEPFMCQNVVYRPGIQLEEAIEITRHCFFTDEQMKLTERKVKSQEEFSTAYHELLQFWNYERYLTEMYATSEQKENGYYGRCIVCNAPYSFLVDYQNADVQDGKAVPNWRERLVCPNCHCNNRQRFMIHKILDNCRVGDSALLYERKTPVYEKIIRDIPTIKGFEYMGEGLEKGAFYGGVEYQDICDLTYDDESFELLISNDVFEHVNDYEKAFREACRVLKPGGKMIFTVPFDANSFEVHKRAEKQNGQVFFYENPCYHNNPMENMDPLLVWNIFGWKMLDELRDSGFSDAYGKVYYSIADGYLGYLPIYFEAIK